MTAIDKFFEPLVEKFAELDEKDQASLAFIYQGTAPPSARHELVPVSV